jgi:hypothetical protein
MTLCTICRHKQLPAIERALSDGKPYRTIAAQYGVGVMSLSRHNSKGHPSIRYHVPGGVWITSKVTPELKQALIAEARRRRVPLSGFVRELLQTAYVASEWPDGQPTGIKPSEFTQT